MPATPLIDLEALDLSRTVVPKAELLGLLRQRGTFEMIDALVHFDPTDDLVVGYKDLAADDWWARDHIPGRPLFPGVLMLEAAAQLASYHFMRRAMAEGRGMEDTFLGFGGVENTRFRAPVEPPARLVIAARTVRVRSRMFTYLAQGFVGARMVFETEVLGVVV